MATIAQLEAAGLLFKLDPALDVDEQELRLFHTSPRLSDRLQNVLPTSGSSWDIENSPAEQLDALIAVYASGLPLTYGWQFKPIRPIGDGVWELKTADLRIFGWFAARDCLIGVVADTKEHIREHTLYPGYRGEVTRFRAALELNAPKFIPGDDPNAVVSNNTFP